MMNETQTQPPNQNKVLSVRRPYGEHHSKNPNKKGKYIMNKLFYKLLAATCSILSVPADSFTISKGKKKRWRDLAAIWKNNPAVFNNVFYSALHHIQLGKYPHGGALKQEGDFGALLEEAILRDPDAFPAWKSLPAFRDSFRNIQAELLLRCDLSSASHSSTITYFLYNRLMVLTFYRDPACAQVDLARVSSRDLHRAKSAAVVRSEYFRFMAAMKKLVPEAESWDEKCWVSEKKMLTAVHAALGLTFPHDLGLFDQIMEMMMNIVDHRPYYKQLFVMKSLPDSVITTVWPTDIEKAISRQFQYWLSSKTRYEKWNRWHQPEYYNDSLVQSSWAYRELHKWRNERKISHKTKRALMDYGLNIVA